LYIWKGKKLSQTQQISVALYGFVDVLLILFVGRHVSAPALGHHQVLNYYCSEATNRNAYGYLNISIKLLLHSPVTVAVTWPGMTNCFTGAS
jgi:hypothetical protein